MGFLKESFITDAQFAETIQEYEMYLIQSNGAYMISSTEHSSRPSDPGQMPQNAQGEFLSDDESNQSPLDALKKKTDE